MNKPLVRQGLPILIAIGLLWYVLKDVTFPALIAQFRQANYWWLALAGFLIALSHLARAARWQLTLQAIGYNPSLFHTTIALLAGALASMIIPGAGELTRCSTLQRTDNIPIAKGIGSVVAERVIDLLMLGVMVALTFLLEFNRVGHYLISLLTPLQRRVLPDPDSGFTFLFALAGVGFLFIIVYWFFRRIIHQQHPFIQRILAVGRDVGKGFTSIWQLKQPKLFMSLTVLSYGLIFLATYILFLASSQTRFLPPTAALTILAVGSLGGIAVPTQAGIGTFHFLVSRVLLLYGLSKTGSIMAATFIHAIGFSVNLLLSGISFLLLPMILSVGRKKSSPSPTD